MTPEELMRVRRDLAAIRTRIEELRDAIQEHSKTIHAAQEAQQHSSRSREPMPVIVAYDKQTARQVQAENDRQYGTQNAIKNWTKAAVFAASIYAFIAAITYLKIRTSTEAATAAVRLTQQQLVGTQEAVVRMNPIDMDIERTQTGGVALANDGHVTASDVRTSLSVIKLRLPSMEAVSSPRTFEFTIPRMEADPGIHRFNQYPFKLDLSPQNIDSIKQTRLTIRVSGQLSYGNGFGESTDDRGLVKDIRHDTLSCDQFDATLRDAQRWNETEEAKAKAKRTH